jgi:hypothetical protein
MIMPNTIDVKQVGAQDLELRNSPVAEELDDEAEVLKQELPGEPVCYFNNQEFNSGDYVCSGNALLQCDYGVWMRSGSCDSDNP